MSEDRSGRVARSGRSDIRERSGTRGSSPKVGSPGRCCSQDGVFSGRVPANLTEMLLSGAGRERDDMSCPRGRL